jgi:p-methyltransferase
MTDSPADILLLSQEESHPFYRGINSYFHEALLGGTQADLGFFFKPPPLGITLLASHLNRNGFSAVPVHNFFTLEDSKRRLAEHLRKKPFAVGISTTHLFTRSMLDEITGLVGRLSPGSRLIAGGPGAEWNTGLRPDGAITVMGPGENTLLELLKALKAGGDISRVPNLEYYDGGRLRRTPRADNSPLDLVPEPDWGLYPVPPARVPLQGARGCRHKCGFCSYPAGFGSRGVPAVMEEIRSNRRKWGINFFRFTDSDLADGKERTMELCRALESDGGYCWTCFARADSLLDRPLLAAMKRAGCRWVFLGVESGSEKILKAMNKGCGVSKMKEAIAGARAAGIGVHGNFVVGYPGEDAGTIRETLDFIRGSGLDTVYFSPFQLRSLDSPVYLARKAYRLNGDFGSWRHATMTSDEVLAQARALMDEVALGMETPVPASEAFFSLFSDEGGGGLRENALAFSRAIRDWHRAGRTGNGLEQAEAHGRIRVHLEALR